MNDREPSRRGRTLGAVCCGAAGVVVGWLASTPVALVGWGLWGDAPWPAWSSDFITFAPPITGAAIGVGAYLAISAYRARRKPAG